MTNYRKIYYETKTLSVLLVEDFEPLRKEMVEVLGDLFKSVTSAVNGEEALALYQETYASETSYDLVISDIQMPKMNGVELSKHIRALNASQVIIILSGHTDSAYLLELINIGVSKFITKPIDYDIFFPFLYEESKKIKLLKPKETDTIIKQIAEGYHWNMQTKVLTYKETPINLTKHELFLLEFFISKEAHLCSTYDIIDMFDEKNIEISEKNIRNLIFKLRQKVPEECIQSVYGLGYKFMCGNS